MPDQNKSLVQLELFPDRSNQQSETVSPGRPDLQKDWKAPPIHENELTASLMAETAQVLIDNAPDTSHDLQPKALRTLAEIQEDNADRAW